MEKLKLLFELVENFYSPCVLTKNDNIIMLSKSTLELFNNKNILGLSLKELILTEAHTNLNYNYNTSKTIFFKNESKPLPVNAIKIELSDGYVFYVFADLKSLYEIFLSYFLKIQRTPIDVLWIISEDYKIIYRNGKIEKELIGQCLLDIVEEKEKLINALEDSKTNKCEIIKSSNKLKEPHSDKAVDVSIDITYIHPNYSPGYYLLASRQEKTINAILNRMKEAMLVETDTELAKALNISKSTLSKFKGQDKLPLELAYKVFISKNISIDWLLTGKGKKTFSDGE